MTMVSMEGILKRNKAHLSLIGLGGGMISPYLAFRQSPYLLHHALADCGPYSLIQTENVGIQFFDFPMVLVMAWVDKHDERQNLLSTIIGPDGGMDHLNARVRQVAWEEWQCAEGCRSAER
jgi:hypothetical protein